MRMRHVLNAAGIVTLTLVLASIIAPSPGFACSCGPEPEVSVALAGAQYVFSGRVVGLQLVPSRAPEAASSPGLEDLEVSFEVHTVWKGEITETAVVYTGFVCCACGYPFEIGEEYLVYTNPSEDDAAYTSLCTRTRRVDDAAEDLNTLGEIAQVLWTSPPMEDE